MLPDNDDLVVEEKAYLIANHIVIVILWESNEPLILPNPKLSHDARNIFLLQ